MNKTLPLFFAAVLPLMAGNPGTLTTPATDSASIVIPPVQNGEFPLFDDSIWGGQQLGMAAKIADRLITAEPAAPRTLQLLSEFDRYEQALEVLKRIIESHPKQIAQALEGLTASRTLLATRRSMPPPRPNLVSLLNPLVAKVVARLPQMEHNESVRTAGALLRVQGKFMRGDSGELVENLRP